MKILSLKFNFSMLFHKMTFFNIFNSIKFIFINNNTIILYFLLILKK
jgi:hypothetical protein